jgi:acyl dehydratase
MAIDVDRLMNWPFQDVVQSYTAKEAMLYALGIGLGGDPMDEHELRFVYERDLLAFPTMAVVLGHPGAWNANPATGIDRTMVVHGEQALTLHKPLPATGTVRARERVLGLVDKGEGRGALIYTERRILDHETGEPVATLNSTSFARADGGFGGPTGPVREPHVLPRTTPDTVVEMPTFPQQALLYRLNADYNPLHSDPEVARKAGYPRPILHGLCTYGVAAHAVLKTYCGYDPARLKAFQVRFSAPVFPGETIAVEMWKVGETVSFRAFVRARDAKVVDNGRAIVEE